MVPGILYMIRSPTRPFPAPKLSAAELHRRYPMPTRHPWSVIMRPRSRNAIQKSARVASHQPTPEDQEDQPSRLLVLIKTPRTNVMRSTNS